MDVLRMCVLQVQALGRGMRQSMLSVKEGMGRISWRAVRSPQSCGSGVICCSGPVSQLIHLKPVLE